MDYLAGEMLKCKSNIEANRERQRELAKQYNNMIAFCKYLL
jgi:hypothetical protein